MDYLIDTLLVDRWRTYQVVMRCVGDKYIFACSMPDGNEVQAATFGKLKDLVPAVVTANKTPIRIPVSKKAKSGYGITDYDVIGTCSDGFLIARAPIGDALTIESSHSQPLLHQLDKDTRNTLSQIAMRISDLEAQAEYIIGKHNWRDADIKRAVRKKQGKV